jgi:hypothetical protein
MFVGNCKNHHSTNKVINMKNQKIKTAKKTYLKGFKPRTIRFPSGRKLKTNGLTKREWDSVKEKFEKMTPEDRKTAKVLLSI